MIGRNLRTHVAVVSALCGLFGVLVTVVVYHRYTRELVLRGARPDLSRLVANGELARCEAAPERWWIDGPGRATTWAYDLDGTSRNPDAPPMRASDLDAALAVPVGEVTVVLRGYFHGGAVLARPAASGPCAVTASYWKPAFGPGQLLAFGAVIGGAVALGTSLLIALAGIAPLTRRIARVRRAAARVGEATGYAPAEQGATDDLGQVSAELDRAHARLRAHAERAEQSRRDLQRHLANVAHDLKTPIASLQLALEQAVSAKDDPATLDRLLAGAVRDLVYLGGLTANLRLASELEQGWSPAAGVTTSLSDVVERAAARVLLLARQNRITLDVAVPDRPVVVPCDPTAAERAVANVVDNAVIHGVAGGHVAVVLRTLETDRFELVVLDDGPGVAPHELPRLGERTFRADAARRRDGRGGGLGLAITREIAARCGWELSFAREEPQGLRVTLRGVHQEGPDSFSLRRSGKHAEARGAGLDRGPRAGLV